MGRALRAIGHTGWQAGHMCGRYAASRRTEDLVEEFEIEATEGPGPGTDPAAAEPDYNVAPTKLAPVVLERRPRPAAHTSDAVPASDSGGSEDGEDRDDAELPGVADPVAQAEPDDRPVRWLRLLTWGLVPSWAKDRSIGSRMINARAETLLDKSFRKATLTRRCLVPADGWYEWQPSPSETDAKGKPRKQPFYIEPIAAVPIAFAGIYEFWRDPAVHPDDPAAWLTSYAVITTAAEPGLDRIHDRMPLALPADRWDDWLDPELREEDAVRALLAPPLAGRFMAVPVSTRVNAVANNGPELVAPLPREQLHGVLDPQTGELIGGDSPLF